jgi:hypothetical protein
MLIFIVVCAIGVPLMLWALSSPSRKPAAGTGHHPTGDLASLPPAAAGGFDAAPSCDAGGGGCDAG